VQQKLNVLVCEDIFPLALALADLLEDHGHRVAGTAATSVRALEIADEEKPDLAIVDLNLADGWTGPELVRQLAAMRVTSIVVTGQHENFDNEGSAAAVFGKPVDEAKLMAFISGLASDLT
jgi:DNA-binding response OmpR family regulator